MSRTERSTNPWGEHQLDRFWDVDEPWATLVIVHGLGEHSGRYEHVGDAFAEVSIQVSAFDLEGHGGSGGRRAHVTEWARYLDQLEAGLASAQAPGLPLILFGHSYGGLVGYEYLHSGRSPAPDLAILSTPALGGGAVWQRALAPVAAVVAPRLALPNGFGADDLSRDPAVGEAYFADPLVETKSTARLGNETFLAMKRVEGAGAPPMPTLVTHGGSDPIVPPRATAPLGELEGVDRILYPKLRHETMNEPEGPEVIADMIAWIRKQLGQSSPS